MGAKGRKKKGRYVVFLSHASEDAWIAGKMAESIRKKKGLDVWLDERNLDGGDRIDQAVVDGIQVSSEVLVLGSSASIESDWVEYEAGVAVGMRKPMTFVCDKIPADQAPAPLNGYLTVNLNDFEKLVKGIARRAARAQR